MLQRKMVLQFECGNIFAKMNNSAFIVDNSSLNFPGPKRPWQ